MSIDTNNSASTRTVIDWSKAPEGATHAAFLPDIQQHIFFKFADDRWFDVKNKEWSYVGGKPNLQHIVKKALCAGKRGAKDWAKDVQEIADTANRLIELEVGK